MCQSLQGFSYLLTGLPRYLTRLLGRCQSLQGFSYLLTSIFILSSVSNCKCQSLQGFSYLLTGNELVVRIPADMVSIPSRVLISSNTVAISDLKGNMIACQSLQGFSYLLTLSLQSRYFSMLIHHFAGQIHFSLYHPIHTYAKMPFSPVFMLCAADFTKYTSIMFSMSINLTIILYIMQVLLATVLASFY